MEKEQHEHEAKEALMAEEGIIEGDNGDNEDSELYLLAGAREGKTRGSKERFV